MKNKRYVGHILALITILIWSTTFISTKILLKDFQPIEILLMRFMIGWIALFCIDHHQLKLKDKKETVLFVLAGLCGICLYYLLENIALTYTSASHVGVIISVAPFFTALLTKEKKQRVFYLGFVFAILGIMLMSFQGEVLKLNPFGDVLAFIAAIVWACYSLLSAKIGKLGYSVILSTRKTMSYGILMMIPYTLMNFHVHMTTFPHFSYMIHLLYLGLGASALCFVSWNQAVHYLGATQTSIYIYLVPVITVIVSCIVLHEEMTMISIVGILLTLLGLVLSKYKGDIEDG